jgi:replication factor A1
MINVPLKDIIAKISQKSGMNESEISSKIAEKVSQLYGLVSEEGAAHIIANELGIKIFEVLGELKIKDILIGMKSVDVVGKVIRKYELREFNTEKRKGKVANLFMADESGSIRVVFWNDKTNDFEQIKEGDVLKIKGAYVRDNSGRKELHLGDNSHVLINPANVTVNAKERKEYDRKHLSELQENMTVEILGTIVQVFDIKFFEVCPKCNKRMRLKNEVLECEEHGVLPPNYNYILNIFLDDGTGNVRVNLWKLQSQRLLKMVDADVLKYRDHPEDFEAMKNKLLGEQVKVLGTTKINIMGRLEFTADLIFTDLKPEQEIEMLDHAKSIVLETNKYDANANNKQDKAEKSEKPKKDGSGSDDEFEISEDFLEE